MAQPLKMTINDIVIILMVTKVRKRNGIKKSILFGNVDSFLYLYNSKRAGVQKTTGE
jgi:hypothetical protein